MFGRSSSAFSLYGWNLSEFSSGQSYSDALRGGMVWWKESAFGFTAGPTSYYLCDLSQGFSSLWVSICSSYNMDNNTLFRNNIFILKNELQGDRAIVACLLSIPYLLYFQCSSHICGWWDNFPNLKINFLLRMDERTDEFFKNKK